MFIEFSYFEEVPEPPSNTSSDQIEEHHTSRPSGGPAIKSPNNNRYHPYDGPVNGKKPIKKCK